MNDLRVLLSTDVLTEISADLMVIPLFEKDSGPGTGEAVIAEIDQAMPGLLAAAAASKRFEGKHGQILSQLSLEMHPARRIVLLGLGRRSELTEEALRRAGALLAQSFEGTETAAIALHHLEAPKDGLTEALATGILLALYRFDRMKSKKEPRGLPALAFAVDEGDAEGVRAALESARILTEAVGFARDLGNRPGNDLTPKALAETAMQMAEEVGLLAEILDEGDMKRLGMGALLGVARGSSEPPRMIVLEHGREFKTAAGPVCLVGKGLTFDAGGISIKPAGDMDKMRYDMCGGAAVLGAMRYVAAMGLERHVVGIVPASENLPDGAAMKPGDILTALNGKTIEVLNTDAEGRLILADALVYAQKYKPSLIIDLATLTGAVSIALGSHMAGMLGTGEDAIQSLLKIGQLTGERVWRLPLDPDYDQQIQGKWADLQNIGGREAGTITAAQFLKHFVADVPWVHLDIAGVAWDDSKRPYARGSGATGFGVRLLARFLEDAAAS